MAAAKVVRRSRTAAERDDRSLSAGGENEPEGRHCAVVVPREPSFDPHPWTPVAAWVSGRSWRMRAGPLGATPRERFPRPRMPAMVFLSTMYCMRTACRCGRPLGSRHGARSFAAPTVSAGHAEEAFVGRLRGRWRRWAKGGCECWCRCRREREPLKRTLSPRRCSTALVPSAEP